MIAQTHIAVTAVAAVATAAKAPEIYAVIIVVEKMSCVSAPTCLQLSTKRIRC